VSSDGDIDFVVRLGLGVWCLVLWAYLKSTLAGHGGAGCKTFVIATQRGVC